jgi:hypothetical protein
MGQSDLCKKQDPISKLTTAKRASCVAQAVEHLPSKVQSLEFKSQYHQKQKQIKRVKDLSRHFVKGHIKWLTGIFKKCQHKRIQIKTQ